MPRQGGVGSYLIMLLGISCKHSPSYFLVAKGFDDAKVHKLPSDLSRDMQLQGCSKEETREHVHSLICGLQGRKGCAILRHLNPQAQQESEAACEH